MLSVTHGLYFSSIFFFFKVLFQKLFEVNVQNVQKSNRDCLLAFNFSSLSLCSGVFSSLGVL